jgi:threonine dehydrogenase-like Zn-dependent dehydrogenase
LEKVIDNASEAFALRGLCKRFAGCVALVDVSFALERGEVVALIGLVTRTRLRQSLSMRVTTGERQQALCRPAGADVVIEVCGDAQVIPAGMAMLRVGGVYVVAGVVNPRSEVVIDANLLLGKLLTLRGVHNYHPRDLIAALDFVVAQRRQFPFSALVDGRYALDEVGAAMADAAAGRVLRAAIVP